MSYSAEQVINGLINYADAEVMTKLPTSGKWVMGTAIGLATSRVNKVIDALKTNSVVHVLDIVDDEGMIDVDAVINSMKISADKYGNVSFEIPLVGKMSFSSSDLDSLRNYIG